MANVKSDNSAWSRATAGTYVDRSAPRAAAVVFVVVALAFVLVPLVGMAWARTDTTTENRTLAAFPSVFEEDGTFNWNILPDLGAYFDDHYAYRNEAVTANAYMRAVFGTSATDQVVLGSDGWLYYGGTLPDYLGQNQLSDRSLANIAHNLSLAQGYAEKQGASFAFTLSPNKNTLDPSSMPYYYLPYEGASNAERLVPYLQDAGVNYVDLFAYFQERMAEGEDFSYLKLDSHWNNRWALLATDELLQSVGRDELPVDPESGEIRTDFAGDLQSMLYPASQQLEENYYYAGYNDREDGTGSMWSYEEGGDVTDSSIRTVSSESSGSLLMFRDSFGNALLPYWAASYENASFSKLIPYNLTQISQLKSDTVIIERAERHLDYLAANPPIMSNPSQPADSALPEGAREVQASVDWTTSGSYWVVQGTVEEELTSPASSIFVVVQEPDSQAVMFDPFWTSAQSDSGEIIDDRGFMIYAPTSSIDFSSAEIKVYVSS